MVSVQHLHRRLAWSYQMTVDIIATHLLSLHAAQHMELCSG